MVGQGGKFWEVKEEVLGKERIEKGGYGEMRMVKFGLNVGCSVLGWMGTMVLSWDLTAEVVREECNKG